MSIKIVTKAHVQGIAPEGNNSGWIGPGNGHEVPEPSTLLLLGSGLVGLGLMRKRKTA